MGPQIFFFKTFQAETGVFESKIKNCNKYEESCIKYARQTAVK